MSSSVSLEVDQQVVVIEDINPPSKIRKVVMPSEHQEQITEQPAAQSLTLPLVAVNQEKSTVEKGKITPKRTELESTIALVIEPEVTLDVSEPTTVTPLGMSTGRGEGGG